VVKLSLVFSASAVFARQQGTCWVSQWIIGKINGKNMWKIWWMGCEKFIFFASKIISLFTI